MRSDYFEQLRVVHQAVEFVLRCWNADGGFGTRPGSESHAGQIYCCLGVLSIARSLHRIQVSVETPRNF